MQQPILDQDILLRRVLYLDPRHIKPDGKPSSMAFSLRKRDGVKEHGLSVDLERLTTYARSIKDTGSLQAVRFVCGKSQGVEVECLP